MSNAQQTPPSVAVVGATGAVGREMLTVLQQREFPLGSLALFASPRSAGARLPFRGQDLPVQPLSAGSLAGIDIALFSAGSSTAKAYALAAADAGVIVVDNSSAFREDPRFPLVVPGVNDDALAPLAPPFRGPVLAPVGNCSVIIMVAALEPLRRAFGLRAVTVSTYQAASGAGAQAMDELRTQTAAVLAGDAAQPRVFKEPYAFNLFSHNAAIDPATGYNGEELKMISETRRIYADPTFAVSPTCVRVPTMRAHAQSINVTLARSATEDQVRRAIADWPGLVLVDDRDANAFPTPLKASGRDDVLVGRVRRDLGAAALAGQTTGTSNAPTTGFALFVAGDQLRKGAATTAVELAERLWRLRR